jgi:hypothetical protein
MLKIKITSIFSDGKKLLNIIYKKVTVVILMLLETEGGKGDTNKLYINDSIIFRDHALLYNKNALQRLV